MLDRLSGLLGQKPGSVLSILAIIREVGQDEEPPRNPEGLQNLEINSEAFALRG